ncbi:hypothetical protein AB0D66_29425 [Streptomyces sp. NPDC048270]|uniref:hypothetical protein n=1 Tax=Streptomyces sp. NPDC048270 TaxID=3154615 RepID=UPI0033F350E9
MSLSEKLHRSLIRAIGDLRAVTPNITFTEVVQDLGHSTDVVTEAWGLLAEPYQQSLINEFAGNADGALEVFSRAMAYVEFVRTRTRSRDHNERILKQLNVGESLGLHLLVAPVVPGHEDGLTYLQIAERSAEDHEFTVAAFGLIYKKSDGGLSARSKDPLSAGVIVIQGIYDGLQREHVAHHLNFSKKRIEWE